MRRRGRFVGSAPSFLVGWTNGQKPIAWNSKQKKTKKQKRKKGLLVVSGTSSLENGGKRGFRERKKRAKV